MKDLLMTMDEKFQAVDTYKQNLDDYFINFGELLSDIKERKAFRIKGYKTFKEFIEDEYNINAGFANKLISLYDIYIKHLGLDEASVREIGMEKLHIIKPVVLDDEKELQVIEEWLKAALNLPVSELKDKVKEVKKENPYKTMKEVFVEQYLERMTTVFNFSVKELNYKLALYFDGFSSEGLDIRKLVKKQALLLEEELNRRVAVK